MTVRERMLALSLLERAEKNAGYIQKIGVTASMKECKAAKEKEKNNV